MKIVKIVESIIYFIFLILIIINKNINNMKKVISWFKSLFIKKAVKNEEPKRKSAAIKNPSGTPTRGPR